MYVFLRIASMNLVQAPGPIQLSPLHDYL